MRFHLGSAATGCAPGLTGHKPCKSTITTDAKRTTTYLPLPPTAAFATSVGSKALKLWQACCIAAVMEFTGAVALGGEVTKTVAGSIADVNTFKQYPE